MPQAEDQQVIPLQEEAEKIRRERLEAAGLADQYDLWRESMPETRMPEHEVYETFMKAQQVEGAAIEGRVSVSTGGEEVTAGTDMPTPGPDDEETGPDEAGEVSEGGDEDTTDLKVVEGMWVPPEEAEAENYIEPTTDRMSKSKDWIDNARIVHKFMGSPKQEPIDKTMGGGVYFAQAAPQPRDMTDAEIGHWARNQLSMFNWNVMATMNYAQKIMNADDPKTALAFLNLINMYDHSDGGAVEFQKALGGVSSDPTTYVGLGVGTAAAKGAALATAKAGLKKKATEMMIVGATAGAVEGGMLAGGYDLTVQNVEQEAGAREDISAGRAALATGAGVALGTLLGGLGGRWAGHKMDKWMKAIQDEYDRVSANADVLAERQGAELGEAELLEMLQASQRATDMPAGEGQTITKGQRDEAAQMADAILGETGEIPRLEDGSMDFKKIYSILEDVKAENELARIRAMTDEQKAAARQDVFTGMVDNMVEDFRQSWLGKTGPEGDSPTLVPEDDIKVNDDGLEFPDYMFDEPEDFAEIEKFASDNGARAIHPEQSTSGRVEIKGTKEEISKVMADILANRNKNYRETFKSIHGVYPDEPIPDNVLTFPTAEARGITSTARGLDDWVAGKFDEGWGVHDGETGKLLEVYPSEEAAGAAAAGKEQVIQPMPSSNDVAITDRQGWREQGESAGMIAPRKFTPKIASEESQALVQKIIELDELEKGDVVLRGDQRPGSRVVDELGKEFEVVGRTKNGWYRLRDSLGREHSLRRKQFEVVEKAPAPRKAGPMELDPFSSSAAKVMAMNEQVVSGKLQEVKITHREQAAIVEDLRDMGIDITEKQMASYWTPAELMFLRDTYNAQANGIADLARRLESKMRNEGRLLDSDLARFNNAHSQFVATRDLFFGTSGNAARQLNILRSKPAEGVYEFNQMLMDSISLQGGRANTERAIKMMSDFAKKGVREGQSTTHGVSKMSDSIWGNKYASWLLNVRYNMMLSSWRTHAFNFMGNSASGLYQHLMVSPVKMGINNMAYARDLAWGQISGNLPDPADRITRHQWVAELRGHYAGFRESLSLAKEIALGRDIGEGKVWNELGLRYHVVNVPDGWFGKLGTTPVRALEAGDAFFKNQYYNSKIHELASTKARTEEVHQGMNFEARYNFWVENADGAMQRTAKEFAQKQTYTNDPNVYGGVLAALAKGVSTAQNKNMFVNMLIPFVRTPANLLSYSMEMIGANTVLSPGKTYHSIMNGTAQESQEALARLTVATGLWLAVAEMYENGDITGTGPSNFEERKVWEAAGWQPNSIKVRGKWVDISRADPAGQSLATIASVYDYYAMTRQQDKPAMEWIGAGLLYTSDMIIDESYLSTVSDMITAIQSKETGRAQSVTASMINSIVVPNLMRDVRRPADETMRSGSSVNLLDSMQKQMMNASPWHSEDLPPQRDWKGDIKNYYGNVYERALLPFNVKDSTKQDKASMALSYARIPVATPSKTISWPGGLGDAIDLFAMDNGDGYVYDRYLETIGRKRGEAVNVLLNTPEWTALVKDENVGPGSEGETLLRKALGIGSKAGRLEMLSFLIEHSGDNNTYRRSDGKTFQIHHQVSVDEYIRLRNMVRSERVELPEDFEQYRIKKREKGPEFFKP